jgi:hypothetical protein
MTPVIEGFDMSRLDITRQNEAVEATLERTDNPRHRYLLQAYLRHRYLESAGRWEEILDPSLTVEDPVYRFSLVWPYDDQGRLLGEDVWDFDDSHRAHIRLDPADMLTSGQSRALLDPFIKPLAAFEPSLLPG